jgi:DNA replication protein DnaC
MLTGNSSIQDKIIGKHKYTALKSWNLENLPNDFDYDLFNKQFNIPVSTGLKLIKAYEEKNIIPQAKKYQQYFQNLKNQPAAKPKQLTKQILWSKFRESFYKNEGVNFEKNKNTLENIKPLFYFFLGDLDSFKRCKNVNHISEPNLNKGLLIIGNYGNGKSATFKALETALRSTNIQFKGYTANEVVNIFEACEKPTDKDEFYRTMNYGTRYFDDVKTERTANNYGKAELIKDILEARYINKARTYITCNFKDGADGDVELALLEFRDKYGNRVYDRLFEMFNVIIFKGDSFRK